MKKSSFSSSVKSDDSSVNRNRRSSILLKLKEYHNSFDAYNINKTRAINNSISPTSNTSNTTSNRTSNSD